MTSLSSALYIIALVALAVRVARGQDRVSRRDRVAANVLSGFVSAASVFFGSFFVLGFLELATGWQAVGSVEASAIGVPVVVLVGYWIAKPSPARRPRDRSVPSGEEDIGKVGFVPLGTAVLFGVVIAAVAVMLLPAFPRGFEAQAKYLPMGLHFFQEKSLMMWDTIGSHNYPANASVYFGFFLNFGPERLASYLNLVLSVPLLVAVYGMGRAVGADPGSSVWAVIGLLTVPLVAFNLFENQADIGGIAFLAIAAFFVVAKPETRPHWSILAGVAAGIAFGFKPFHLVGGAVLFMVLVADRWLVRQRHATERHEREKAIAAYAIAAAGLAAYWLIRNYAVLGNPLFPVELPFFDALAIPADWDDSELLATQAEWVRSSREWLIYPWLEWHYIGQNYKMSSGLGAFFAATAPVALGAAAACIGIGSLRRSCRHLRDVAILVAGTVLVLGGWWIMGDRQPRYAMGALVFVFPLVAWTISRTTGGARRLYDRLLGAAAIAMLVVFSSTLFLEIGDRFVVSRQFARHRFYEYPAAVDNLRSGATVLNLGGRSWSYALYGTDLQNRVVSFKQTRALLAEDGSSGPQPQTVSAGSLGQTYRFDTALLRRTGATHLFVLGSPEIRTDGCSRLREVDRLDTNPTNGVQFPRPRILYEITYCAGGRVNAR